HLVDISNTLQAGTARVKMVDALSTDTYGMQGSLLLSTLDGARYAADHQGDVRRFASDLSALRPQLTTSSDRAALADIQQAFAGWKALDARAVALLRARGQSRAAAQATNAADHATGPLSHAAQKLSGIVSTEDRHSASSSKSSAILISIILAVISILLGIGIVILQSRRIVGGVRRMLKAAKRLSRGEVERDVIVRGKDEIAAMGHAFNEVIGYLRETAGAAGEMGAGNFAVEIAPRSDQDALRNAFVEMRDRVGEVVRAISGTSDALNSSSLQMASTTQQVGRAIDEIAESVGQVASGAEEQVRAVDQVRAMSEEVATASRASSASAAETAQAAAEARASAEVGEHAVAKVDEAMRGVQTSSADVSAAIRQLGEKSGRIGGIVDTITAISEQTNLLALNAAIEAARAGEQGKGFAVVAEEVRKLAEESQHAAALIADLVDEIRSGTERAVTVVEQGVRQTDEGARTVTEARESFRQIRDNVESMTARIELIAASSEQIVESATRMLENVSSVANVAEESSASTEQVSAATQQTSASTQQIASSAQELSATADELQRLVSQFTLS
ncbi:MAG TPA: HAMP domain-containing methyl-accepting chemotaxis protein, partial [Solirubrobacteraceae bacterium]|nr:HAMP domain-containing methyl-accepting chemotaxis protein [Solirubrobacteraceae bacterium]